MFDEIFDTCRKILDKKNHDYANKDDIFKNFREVSQIASIMSQKDITAEDIFNIYIAMKISREANLRRNNKIPLNESLKDTITDMINYIVLKAEYFNQKTIKKES